MKHDKGYISANMADPEFVWTYKGSENHHLQGYVSAWSAAHILSRSPKYSSMTVAGLSMSELATNLDGYFKLYFKEKATKGLLTEIASPTYLKYSLNTLYNLYDFADDPELKKLADSFLNVYFTDWAIEQFNGVRGGSKHRAYKGAASINVTESTGWIPFGLGVPSHHPGFMCAATTSWRPDPLVAQLALAQEDRGSYEILSRRPGLAAGDNAGGREASPDGGELLRCTYHTPEFNMGMSMVSALEANRWTAVSGQNRQNLILFNGETQAKIFTQRPVLSKGSVYNAEWGVQNKGVMMLQALPKPYSKSLKGQYVYFGDTLTPIEKDGWRFIEAPGAYCAVKVVEGQATLRAPRKDDFRGGKGAPKGLYLVLERMHSPIIFEVNQKENYSSFEEFQHEIQSNQLIREGDTCTYHSKAYQNSLTLFADYSALPQINGETIDLNPSDVYTSPFLNGCFGGNAVTISMGDQELELDFKISP
jgi:hypothetical protein